RCVSHCRAAPGRATFAPRGRALRSPRGDVHRGDPRGAHWPAQGVPRGHVRVSLPLEGVRVIDVATLGAGPWLATRLADFGADVLKVEHPSAGDPLRTLGYRDGDVPLWWKVDARNKRSLTLDLKTAGGADVLRRLVRDADV